MARKVPEGPSWKVRRRIIVATLVFCAGEIIYLTGWGKDHELSRTIATGVLLLAGSTIGSYIFGAVWDSRNVMVNLPPEDTEDPPSYGPSYRRRGPRGFSPGDDGDDGPPPHRGS